MQLFLQISYFILSLALIIKSADILVTGASSLARRFKMSELAIGLTVVAFGTSMPEFVVNLFGSISGYNDIVFGNIIGSNIFNILLILGISGAIFPLKVQKNTTWKEIPFSIFAALLLLILVNDVFIDRESVNLLSRTDGIILLLFFAMFLIYVIRIAKVESVDSHSIVELSSFRMGFYIIGGLTGLALGGRVLTNSAVYISHLMGISERFISITVVAAGTSLPELATSVVAAYRKKSDIAVGNIVGSNIFNILFILGVSGVIRDAVFDPIMNIDLIIMSLASGLLFFTMFIGKVHILEKKQSISFLVIYVLYVVYLIVRK